MKSPPTFVREATGLVRGFSNFDIFVQAFSIVGVGMGSLTILEYLPFFFPGADTVGVLFVSLLVALAFAMLWGGMSAALPRSGGDYVWMTRILPRFPAIGFMYAIMYGVFGQMLSVGGFLTYFYVNSVLSPTITGVGLVTGNSALTEIGQFVATGNGLFMTGLILWGIAILTISAGNRTSSKIINIMWLFSFVVALLWITVGFAFSNGAFQKSFNSQFGADQYAMVIRLGKQAGFTGLAPTVVATLSAGFSLGYLSSFSNFQIPVWVAGELKKSEQIWKPFCLALVLCAVMFVLIIESMFHLMGGDWLGAMSMAASTPSTAGALPFSTAPSFVFFLTVLLRDNPILVFLINAGMIVSGFVSFVVPIIANSRLIFSLSFDRMLPKAMADVTGSSAVPLKAISIVGILGIIWFAVYTYGTFVSAFLGSLPPLSMAWTIAALLFAFFPWLNKDLYEKTLPPGFKIRLLALPIITWLGFFIAITQAWASYAFLTSSLYPAFGEETLLLIAVGSLVAYFTIATFRKRQGIDLRHIFDEIPPE
jgi:APA family basic amino acid/polyamine antiporter